MEESVFRQKAMNIIPSLRPEHHAYQWYVLITVMLGTFMVILDGTIVNIAIPTIMASFGVTLSEVVWVSTAYLIALSVLLAVASWLALHFGQKRVYMLALLIFTISSYLCGIAWNLHSLIFFRIVQGIGGGVLIPVGMTLFSAEFPPEKRTMAFGFYSISVAAAISLGPSVGGYLLEKLTWGWIFFINVPVGLATWIGSFAIIKTSIGKKIETFDFWGLVFLTAFVVALLVGISSGNAPWNAEGWTSRYTITAFTISVTSFVLFVLAELKSKEPIVDLSVFKIRNFFLGNIVLFIFSFTLFGSSFLLPLYLQNGLGYSKIRIGMVLLPIGLMQGLVGPITGWLSKIISQRMLVMIGIICLGISYYFNASFTLYTSESTMLWLFIFRGVACALMFAPVVALTLGSVPEEKMAQATGLFTVQRQIGAALGVAIFETIFSMREIYHEAMYGIAVKQNSPIYQEITARLEDAARVNLGADGWEIATQVKHTILDAIHTEVFIQSIDDNILIAGIITFFSCIPLFFIKTDGAKAVSHAGE
jgi:DHA2 family multidrug resistance protein